MDDNTTDFKRKWGLQAVLTCSYGHGPDGKP